MEDIKGNKITEIQELGTRKYHIKINNKYFVNFKETKSKRGNGSYSNGSFTKLNAMYDTDIIIVSDNIKDSYLVDGRINLRSIITKILNNYGYKFYNIEITEIKKEI